MSRETSVHSAQVDSREEVKNSLIVRTFLNNLNLFINWDFLLDPESGYIQDPRFLNLLKNIEKLFSQLGITRPEKGAKIYGDYNQLLVDYHLVKSLQISEDTLKIIKELMNEVAILKYIFDAKQGNFLIFLSKLILWLPRKTYRFANSFAA